MVDGIEGIGGYGGRRERSTGRRAARPPAGPIPGVPAEAAGQPSDAVAFVAIAALLDDVARLAGDDPGPSDVAATDAITARMLAGGGATLAAQARLGPDCVRALLGAVPPARGSLP